MGMLGRTTRLRLREYPELEVSWTSREGGAGAIPFDALDGPGALEALFRNHGPFTWVVNCIAVLQSLIDDRDPASVRRARRVNGDFPVLLSTVAVKAGLRVVHISTDAVFPPTAGRCTESTPPAPQGTYAATKRLGECGRNGVLNIRCSVIGADPTRGRGLVEWLRSRPPYSRVPGYADHLWVGCTALQVADLCSWLIARGQFDTAASEGSIHHFCPCAPVSKYEVLAELAATLRPDVQVQPVLSDRPVTRQLDTERRAFTGPFPKYAPIRPALRELVRYTGGVAA
jgi:dTDP-4-dehydrorhamnose reductase